MIITIPIRLPSLANARMHWRVLSQIKKEQKAIVAAYFHGHIIPQFPLVVTITRVGKRGLDDDNLQGACKYVRDQIARFLGVDDASDQVTWKYAQKISKQYSVIISIDKRDK